MRINDRTLQWSNYAYRDQVREKQRRAAASKTGPLKEKSAQERTAREEKARRNSAWSGKTAQKEIRELRREKRAKKREWVKKQTPRVKNEDHPKHKKDDTAALDEDANSDTSSVSLEGKPAQSGDEEEDWAEYAKEKKQAKKAKALQASRSGFSGL